MSPALGTVARTGTSRTLATSRIRDVTRNAVTRAPCRMSYNEGLVYTWPTISIIYANRPLASSMQYVMPISPRSVLQLVMRNHRQMFLSK